MRTATTARMPDAASWRIGATSLAAIAAIALATVGGPARATPPAANSDATEARAFEHKDWQLACDNTGTCRAAGYQTQGPSGVDPMSLLLTREAGPATPVRGEVQTGSEDDEAAPARLRLTIDGKPVGALIVVDAKTHTGTLSAAQVAAVVAAVTRRGRVLFEQGPREAHDDVWALSGEGASAVLLKMDELQGRLGTPSALVRKGTRAESSVPPAIPKPVIVAHAASDASDADEALAQRILAGLPLPEACTDESRNEDVRAWRLDDHRLLVSRQCWSGAYNTADAFWIAGDRPPYAATLVTAEAGDFDPRTGMLSYEGKGRGMGDCIHSESWVWNGTVFIHATKTTTGLCRDVAPGGPWDLPTITSDVRPAP